MSKIAGPEALAQFDRERTAVLPSRSGPTGGGGGGGPPGEDGASSSVGKGGSPVAGSVTGGEGLPSSLALDFSQTGRASNEELAHELVLDPNFKIDRFGGFAAENPVFRRIRESFQSAFWDSLVGDLRLDTPCFVRVLRVLGEVRDGILAGTRDTGNIMVVVDLDFIRDQAEKGLYGWQDCVLLMGKIFGVIQQVCL